MRWLFLGVSAALLVIVLLSGVVAVRYLDSLHEQEIAVAHTLAERSRILSGLWLSVQNYNEAVQRFVAESQTANEDASHAKLDQLTQELDSELERYPLRRDSTEAILFDGLRSVYVQQRTIYVGVRQRNPDDLRRKAQELVSQRIQPLQKEIVDWSGRLHAWNEERLENADESRIAEFADMQRSLTRAIVIAFGSGLLLVLAGMAYIVRLERQTRTRYVQLSQNRRELQRLSTLLLDAQESERKSIARELHDEIGQAMGALLVDLGRLATDLSPGRPDLKGQIDAMKSLTERTFQSVRNIALLLRPSMIDDLGLAAALEWQGREVSRRSEIEVEVESENVQEDLPDEIKISVYRIVQEALNNAVRHSGGKSARVVIDSTPGGITIRVTDNGRGFDPERTRGLGLLGIEERVKRLNGTFAVDSAPGRGATLTATLPLTPPGKDAE